MKSTGLLIAAAVLAALTGTLYWSELALVEDIGVSSAMVHLEEALEAYEQKTRPSTDLKPAALALAHAIRDSIQSGWQGTAPSVAGKDHK